MDLRLSRVVTANTVVFASLFCVLVPVSGEASQTSKRLRSNIDDSSTFVLKGNTRPAITSGSAHDLGAVAASQAMPILSLHFALTQAQQSDLTQLLAAQQNRRSKQYRTFLTPEQYADRFGLNTADIAKVTTWLENNGFAHIQAARARTSISFTGTAGQVQSAFHTSIHSYSVNGETHIANSSDPELPRALQGIVQSVAGLHNFTAKALDSTRLASTDILHPHYISGSTPYLVPDDWETIYNVKPLYSAGLTGAPITGETYSMVVVGRSNISHSDIDAFRSAAGLAALEPTTMIVPGTNDPGIQSLPGDEGISDLDLEWAGAIAPNANILFLIADNNPHNGVNDAIKYAIDNNVAPILVTSYGECESSLSATDFATQTALFGQAASQGMTLIAATGNSGAAACDTTSPAQNGLSVYFPASSPNFTAVGGTELNPGSGAYFNSSNNSKGGSATSYIPEVAWNDGNLAATGGGASTLVAKPSWQTGTGVPADSVRDVPDLAFTASLQNYGLLYCHEGSCTNGFLNSSSSPAITGGTAAGSASFAGVVALLIQKTGIRIGPMNANLYSLAAISSNVFHDVTGGNNQVICQGGSTGCPASTGTGSYGYSANAGYDLVTGWGSIDSTNFVEQWSGDIKISANPSSVYVPNHSASNATSSVTSAITVSPVHGFSGPITFSCSVSSSISANITCAMDGNTVNTSGTTNVTITAGTLAKNFKPRKNVPTAPTLPPSALAWLGLSITACAAAFSARKFRLVTVRSAYIASIAALLLLTVGAVSCGSGSAAAVLSLTCNLPEPIVGVNYLGGSCVASSGSTPYTYSVESLADGGTGTGNMPPGFNLNASTGAITGTPTAAGTYPFTIEVTDHNSKTATQSLQLIVQPALSRSGYVTVTATSGAIVNSTNILVTTSF